MLQWYDIRCEDNIVSPFSHCFYKAPITLPAGSLMSYHCGIKASSPDSFVSRQMGGWSTPSAWQSAFPAPSRLPSTLLMRSLVSSTCPASLGVNTLPSSGLSGLYLWQTSGLHSVPKKISHFVGQSKAKWEFFFGTLCRYILKIWNKIKMINTFKFNFSFQYFNCMILIPHSIHQVCPNIHMSSCHIVITTTFQFNISI